MKQVSVPKITISDHYPVCIQWSKNISTKLSCEHSVITYRRTKCFKDKEFIDTFKTCDWQNCFDGDVNSAIDSLSNNFIYASDIHAPVIQKGCPKIPIWLTHEIIYEVHHRDYIFAIN